MYLYFGTPPKKASLDINMAIDYTWTTSFNFPDKSETKKVLSNNDTLYFPNRRSIQPDKIIDKTIIVNTDKNNNITIDFLLYYLQYKISLDNEAIGLAYKFKEQSLSLIHNLYLNDYIDRLSFGFVINDDKRGLLYFGSIPDKLIKNSYKTKLKVDESKNTWGAKVTKVGDYINNDYAYFNSGDELILAPYDYLSFIENVYLKDYISNKTCQRNVDESTRDYIKIYYSCDCNYISYVAGFDIIIDGHRFELKNEELFTTYYRDCRFVIEHKTSNPDQWVFGAHFIRQYNILFDYEDSSITFYTDKPIKTEYYSIIVPILLFISTIMISMSLINGMKTYLNSI